MQKSRVSRICWGSGKYHIVRFSDKHIGDMKVLNRDISRVHVMCVSDLELSHQIIVLSVFLSIVYAVGGWWTKPRRIGIPDTRAGDQLNAVLYVQNQELNRLNSLKAGIMLIVVQRNKLQWNYNRNPYILTQENPFENVVSKMAAILFRAQCFKSTWQS